MKIANQKTQRHGVPTYERSKILSFLLRQVVSLLHRFCSWNRFLIHLEEPVKNKLEDHTYIFLFSLETIENGTRGGNVHFSPCRKFNCFYYLCPYSIIRGKNRQEECKIIERYLCWTNYVTKNYVTTTITYLCIFVDNKETDLTQQNDTTKKNKFILKRFHYNEKLRRGEKMYANHIIFVKILSALY